MPKIGRVVTGRTVSSGEVSLVSSNRVLGGLPRGVHAAPTRQRLLAALVEVGPVWVLTALTAVLLLTTAGLAVPLLCLGLAVVWAVVVAAVAVAEAVVMIVPSPGEYGDDAASLAVQE